MSADVQRRRVKATAPLFASWPSDFVLLAPLAAHISFYIYTASKRKQTIFFSFLFYRATIVQIKVTPPSIGLSYFGITIKNQTKNFQTKYWTRYVIIINIIIIIIIS